MVTQEQLAQAILELKQSNLRLEASQEKTDIKMRETQESLKRVGKMVGNIEDEYDILLVNGKDVAIIETKYKAHTSDVEKLITKKYENFRKLYPEYSNYKHHLGLASFNINEDVKELALKNGVMILQRKGDIIETILP